ncbi:MAG: hemin-degrading factor [Candidatus Omnitrophica bacterium]|nr:hemin-degrading factor [Candidatus Omnitrophota bacterium]
MESANAALSPLKIKERYQKLKEEQPGVRARDAAGQLEVSEAELVASRIGDGVIRLNTLWEEMLPAVEAFGKVMALTRNEYAVHERKGVYSNGNIGKPHGIFVNPDIDLRLFMGGWTFAFAVEEETKAGLRRSLQFFDKSGTAIHKIYLVNDESLPAYEAYIEKYRAQEQTAELETQPAQPPKADRPDEEIDRDGFRAAWEGLKDTHDFFPMLKKFDIGRVQALRLIGEDFAYRVKPESLRGILNLAAERECEIMIFVGNNSCIQIYTGPVKNLKEYGAWYNILDPDFNLHLREDAIDSAWVVRKPTDDGTVTSLELYDKEGGNIALLFGKRKPGIPELELWRDIIGQLERS